MKLCYAIVVLFVCPSLVQAEIYKGVDANGHVTYSSTPIKGGKKIILEPLSTMDPTKKGRSAASAENFPRVDGEMQKRRDDTRYLILQNELVAEEKALKEAEEKLQEGKQNPEVFKGAGGKTYRNVAKYEGKIKVLTEQVNVHQKNVDALKTELSKLK